MTGQKVPISPSALTVGVLAGGRASRLGGRDKAWLCRDGEPQILHWQRCLSGLADGLIVNANRNLARYAQAGLSVVPDRTPDAGPLGGLHALAHACETPWLLTVPVDLVELPDDLLPRLAAAGRAGAFASDRDGAQPLVALWSVGSTRAATEVALATDRLAVHALQLELGMAGVVFDGIRFGNLNTPADLRAAGMEACDD